MSISNKKTLSVILLTVLGGILHFYNLNWGAPFYFHPDERNIASAVSQLAFPTQMNPNFFAYGSLPIYTIYFTGFLFNVFGQLLSPIPYPLSPSFDQAIFISRMYSALFATLLIPLLYLIGKRLMNRQAGILAALLATFSTGFIQFAHFGTFELWLTFFSVCLFWYSLNLMEQGVRKDVLTAGIIFGVLMATKISALVLLPIPILAILLQQRKKHIQTAVIPAKAGIQKEPRSRIKSGMAIITPLFLFVSIASLIYNITNPFVLLDYQAFRNSIAYESSVGLGTLPVFYTGEFFDTIPVLYQLLHVYPFLLNPLLTILLIPAFIFMLWLTYKTKRPAYILLLAIFLILFLSQAVLFIKWTRNMVPSLPFIYLIFAITLSSFFPLSKRRESKDSNRITVSLRQAQAKTILYSIILIISVIFSISYFITAFVKQDTRLAALASAQRTIPTDAQILSEPYDLGITPFNNTFPAIDWFNFYELDNDAPDATPTLLEDKFEENDYIILPSQRILQTRIQNPEQFPKGHDFYTKLLSGELGYTKMYETPCDIFCQITYLGDPVYWWEQTVTVFDRPTVFIFQKIREP